MKKPNQNFVLTIIAAISLVALFSFKSQTSDDKFIMIRTYEPFNKLVSSVLIVTDGEKTLKKVDLEPTRDKNLESNPMKIVAVLNEYKSQGYRLVSHSGSVDDVGGMTYIMEKK